MKPQKVKCTDCKHCDAERSWCRVKALVVTLQSLRVCKVFLDKKYSGS